MQYLKVHDLKLSRMGLGCWTMGGKSWNNGYASGWSDVNEIDIREAILFAIDQGVRHFDNADCYGNGQSEKMLGRTLGNFKYNVTIASKVGYIKNEYKHAYTAKNIRKQCEKSLKNIKRDYLDLYYFHHGNFDKNDCYLDEAMAEMVKLKDEGKIREIGLSAYSTKDFLRLVPKIKPSIIQAWAHMMDDKFVRNKTLVRQMIDKYNLGFVAFSPLNQGLLTGKYFAEIPPIFDAGDHRRSQQKFTQESLEILQPKLEKIKTKFKNKSLTQVAIQYLLANPSVSSIIPGFRNKAQVAANLIAVETRTLNDKELQFIRKTFD
ncbi:MAG: aldo/keto reductase [bacterium]|nr:aldo/keto reductase [bacterium]